MSGNPLHDAYRSPEAAGHPVPAFSEGDESTAGGKQESGSTDARGASIAQLPRREREPEGERQRTTA